MKRKAEPADGVSHNDQQLVKKGKAVSESVTRAAVAANSVAVSALRYGI